MMAISSADISSLDLNLLRVLDAVLSERSATAAARRLHVTQSAVSNSLARLRALFGDPLVVRSGRGLAPTSLAKDLGPRLHAALSGVEETVRSHLAFDPRGATRRFTLACTDAHHFDDVPRLAGAFSQALPKAQLRIVSPDYLEASDGFESGEIDAALVPAPGVKPGLASVELYSEGFAFVARKGHPGIRGTLTAARFNALRHIDTLVVQGRGGVGHRMAGDLFARFGLVRNIALSVPTFSAAGLAASRSDLLAGVPGSLATRLCAILPLQKVRVALPPMAFPMCLVWHPRAGSDPASRFFRDLVVDALSRPRGRRGEAAGKRGSRRS